jgi:amino acid adenylation domain-containing protein
MTDLSTSAVNEEIHKHPTAPSHRVCPVNHFVEFKKSEIDQSITDRFEQQVIRYPSRLAVKTGAAQLTYAELNHVANSIARAILNVQGEGGEPIAFLLDQGVSSVTAILAVLKAGKFYVALDSSFPPSRNSSVVEDCQPGLLLTDKNNYSVAKTLVNDAVRVLIIDEFSPRFPSDNLNRSVSPEAIAYILYTSGSTGRPKGVFQNHRNVLHNIMKYTNGLHIAADDRLTLLSSCNFGASVSDIFGALLNGAALFPFSLREEGMIKMADWLMSEEITIYHSVPTVYRHFLASLTGVEKFPRLRLIKLGGEPVQIRDVELYKKHFHEGCIFHVGLGATEMNIIRQFFCKQQTVISGATVPVGYAMEDTEVLLLDDGGKKVGFNRVGEIAIKSPSLALGYWKKENLTKSVFPPDPNRGDERIYKTGDLGYMLPDGCLLHMGRKDLQVKIRGYKVDINDVEMALRGIVAIKEFAVVGRNNRHGDTQLVAFIVPHKGKALTFAELRRYLRDELPDYMVPSKFVFLTALPRTANGKIDRRALFSSNIDRREAKEGSAGPRSSIEKRLAEIFADVLGLEKIGVMDNFFDLGGDSLMGIDLLFRIEKEFGKQLSPSILLQASSVAKFSDLFENGQESQLISGLVPLKAGGSRSPLFCIAPVAGDLLVYRHLLKYIDTEQPVYGINSPNDILCSSMRETASLHVNNILERFPKGPFCLIGFSSGGIMAFEMALQLHAMHLAVPFLAMLDSTCPVYLNKKIPWWSLDIIGDFLKNIPFWFYYYGLDKDYRTIYIKNRIKKSFNLKVDKDNNDLKYKLHSVMQGVNDWLQNYDPKFYPGHVVYYKAKAQGLFRPFIRDRGWRNFAGSLDVHIVPGRHIQMLQEPNVRVVAGEINSELERAYKIATDGLTTSDVS